METGRPREGQPGEPGQPGLPGTGGGGAGGTGGRGGRGGLGGTSERERHVLAAAIVCVIIAIGLSVGTLLLVSKVDSNTRQITRLEDERVQALRKEAVGLRNADQLVHETEYRICLRQQITRAAVNLDKDHDEIDLPLYDCTPNRVGRPAVRFTATQAAAFRHYVLTTKNLP